MNYFTFHSLIGIQTVISSRRYIYELRSINDTGLGGLMIM